MTQEITANNVKKGVFIVASELTPGAGAEVYRYNSADKSI